MKKVLLTTSALTLLAGAAAADVSLSGHARIGISNSTAAKSATDATKVGTTNYLRNQITFTGSATSDGGLTLSSWTRYRQSAGSSKFSGTGSFAAPRLSISNGSLTLTAGNAGGAINNNGGIWGCGAIMWGCDDVVGAGVWDWASTSSTGTGPNVVRLDMALGSASVSVSGGNGNDSEVAMSLPMGGGSVAVGYDAGSATAAVDAVSAVAAVVAVDEVVSSAGAITTVGVASRAAVESAASVASAAAKPTIVVGYSGTAAGLSVGLRASQSDAKTGYIGSVSAPVGAGSIYVFAGKNLAQKNVYGLRYNQSLGGSVAMQAGMTSAAGDTTVGAGVNFSF
jgi:outer membrane protein OmpU